MAERALRISHIAVRIIATITLVDLGLAVVCTRYFPTVARAVTNGPLGMALTFWTMASSLLLLPYVGFEAWWSGKLKLSSNALLFDALLVDDR